MQVVLLQRVEKLGLMGDIVTVKSGFARNFLLPKKKALRATRENLAYFEGKKAQYEAHNLSLKTEAEKIAKKMTDLQIVLVRQASDSGHLYGSVTARDLVIALKDEGFSLNRSQFTNLQPIKDVGVYPIVVHLHADVSVTIKASIAPSKEEAQALFSQRPAL